MSRRTAHLRSTDGLLSPAVAATLEALEGEPADAALVRLVECYAAAVDDAEDQAAVLADLGPKLLVALEALGASPRARARAAKVPPAVGPGSTALAALRGRSQ